MDEALGGSRRRLEADPDPAAARAHARALERAGLAASAFATLWPWRHDAAVRRELVRLGAGLPPAGSGDPDPPRLLWRSTALDPVWLEVTPLAVVVNASGGGDVEGAAGWERDRRTRVLDPGTGELRHDLAGFPLGVEGDVLFTLPLPEPRVEARDVWTGEPLWEHRVEAALGCWAAHDGVLVELLGERELLIHALVDPRRPPGRLARLETHPGPAGPAGRRVRIAGPGLLLVSHPDRVQAFGLDRGPLWELPLQPVASAGRGGVVHADAGGALVEDGEGALLALDRAGGERWRIPWRVPDDVVRCVDRDHLLTLEGELVLRDRRDGAVRARPGPIDWARVLVGFDAPAAVLAPGPIVDGGGRVAAWTPAGEARWALPLGDPAEHVRQLAWGPQALFALTWRPGPERAAGEVLAILPPA